MAPKPRFVWWSMTVWKDQYHLLDNLPDVVKKSGWQDEICPDTKREHKQGALYTKQQTLRAMINLLPGIHLEGVPSNNEKRVMGLKNYIVKQESRKDGGQTTNGLQANPNYLSPAAMYLLLAKHSQGFATPENIARHIGYNKFCNAEFWYAVNSIILEKPEWINQFSPPQVEKVWRETRQTWQCMRAQQLAAVPAVNEIIPPQDV